MTAGENNSQLQDENGSVSDVGQAIEECPLNFENIIIKFPYRESKLDNNRMEYTLFTTDGSYNQVLVMDDQPKEDYRAVMTFTNCPTDKIYSGKINWVCLEAAEKTRSWSLFSDVPFQQLKK